MTQEISVTVLNYSDVVNVIEKYKAKGWQLLSTELHDNTSTLVFTKTASVEGGETNTNRD